MTDMTDDDQSQNARRFRTALGTCGVRWSEVGIAEVLMPKTPALARIATFDERGECTEDPGAGSGGEHSSDSLVPPGVSTAIAAIVELLEGRPCDLRAIALDERDLDPFRRSVYAATREVLPGNTASYGQIARAIGAPEAAREVGAALGRNPFPIVVPCHRVLAADGALHGFSAPGGIGTKRRMLEIEGAPGFTQQALFA